MATTRYQGPLPGAPIRGSLFIMGRYQAAARPCDRLPRFGYRSTSPLILVAVAPDTQTVPSASASIRTRPRRPIAVPWLTRYGALARPDDSSHWAREAFRLPVTGSSTDRPPAGKKARTSIAHSEPVG